MTKRILITGANRGIGLEFARQLVGRGEAVFATCRQPDSADDLQALQADHPERVSITALDVADMASIDAAWEVIRAKTEALDWLINNAGVNYNSDGMAPPAHYNSLGHLDSESILSMWRTNSLGPLLVAQRFLDLLRAGDEARIVNISSNMGALTNRTSSGTYAYPASKAALNMLTRALAFDVRREGIVTVCINPGWVRTDMGSRGAPVAVEESVGGILRVVDGLTEQDAGRFIRWDGVEMPW